VLYFSLNTRKPNLGKLLGLHNMASLLEGWD
jgi:hypothetical protein